ncbi:MAG TPA: signal peptidase I [Jatrophihabitantaceae bacterium]
MATAQPTASSRWTTKKILTIGVIGLLVALLVAVAVGLGASKSVTGSGMRPTLQSGDRVLGDTSAYAGRSPGRFDVVGLHAPGLKGVTIRRVVGVPGDRVQIRAVGGQPQVLLQPAGRGAWQIVTQHRHVDWGSSPGACCAPNGAATAGDTQTVPPGKYFVLGDNPTASDDSRNFGFVDRSAITGRVSFRIWPPGRVGGRPQLVPLR